MKEISKSITTNCIKSKIKVKKAAMARKEKLKQITKQFNALTKEETTN